MARKDAKADHHQVILANLLKDEGNRYCADCESKGPRWASWNLGVFLCIRCAGIHRNLGVHISRVKSVNLDSWTPEQIETIQKGGNQKAAEIYEATLPDNFKKPSGDFAMENHIRNKYERKMYVDKGKAKEQSAPSTVAKPKKESTHSKKTAEKQRSTETTAKSKKSSKLLAIPRPQGSPKTIKSVSMPDIDKKASPLLDLMGDTPPVHSPSGHQQLSKSSQDIDLLSGNPVTSQAVPPSHPQQQQQQQPSEHSKQDLFLIGGEEQGQGAKLGSNDIMSLYSSAQTQSHYSAYTGTPMQSVYYQQQQQAAALRMAQQQQQQMQVFAVQQQMANLRTKQDPPQMNGMGGFPMQPQQTQQTPGQTLNPDLW